MSSVTLTGRGRRRWLGGHPWIYADDLGQAAAEPGDVVSVHAPDGALLGWGLYSSRSKIALRGIARREPAPDLEFWRERMRAALELRRLCGLLEPAGAERLLAGDADGFPGLVADRYADVLVLQSGSQGSDRMLEPWLELLLAELPLLIGAVLERSDSGTRAHEDLPARTEWLRGTRAGSIRVEEAARAGAAALAYEVSVLGGHKTGHYLDQRENRAHAARFAAGARVLDAFSYDGLFGIRAALAGAKSVLCIDQSQDALERLERNAAANGVGPLVRGERANAMHDLRARAEAGERYELVIVDPPAFAKSRREIEGALRGYRELNRRALSLLAPGGVLVTCSCSYNIDRATFLACLAQASLDAGREARIFHTSGAGPDHPVLATLPESEYLKCVFLRA
jgi:23S rRNA (cytosine1962-C5)-methyltransferase